MDKKPKKKPKSVSIQEYTEVALKFLRREIFHGEYDMDVCCSKEDKKDAAAEIRIDQTYLNFTVTIYAAGERVFLRDKAEYFRLLGHEICHLLTEPLYLWACDNPLPSNRDHIEEVRERQTQRICNAILLRQPENIHLFDVLKKAVE